MSQVCVDSLFRVGASQRASKRFDCFCEVQIIRDSSMPLNLTKLMKQIRKLCISIIQGQRVHIIGIAREQEAENMQKALSPNRSLDRNREIIRTSLLLFKSNDRFGLTPNKAYWSLLTEYLFKLITNVITTQSTSKDSAVRGKEHDVRDGINAV